MFSRAIHLPHHREKMRGVVCLESPDLQFCAPSNPSNVFKKMSHQVLLGFKRLNPKVTWLRGGHCLKILSPPMRGWLHRATSVGMYRCRLRPDYRLTFANTFYVFFTGMWTLPGCMVCSQTSFYIVS